MLETLNKILAILTPSEKRKALILLLLMVVATCFETVSIVSIMPFLTVLGNTDVIETNKWLNLVYHYLRFENHKSFLFFLGFVVFILLIFSNFIRTIEVWAEARYVNMRGHYISKRLLEKYLSRPYIFFTSRNSGDIAKNILDETDKITNGVLKPFIDLVSNTIINVFIISILVVSDPFLAVTITLIIGFIYFFIYRTIKSRLISSGKDSLNANKERYIVINEAFGGIKDVKLMGLESVFANIYNNPSKRRAVNHSFHQIVGTIPKYILEGIAMGCVIMATLYLMSTKESVADILPLLGLYAYAGRKIIPAMQAVFAGFTTAKYNGSIVANIYNEFNDDEQKTVCETNSKEFGEIKKIELQNLSFKYPNIDKSAINDINLSLDAKTTIGLAGTTGSGKTTLIDVVLGLLEPTTGRLIVNDKNITVENLRSWQKKLGYVPQHIFLIDDTVAKNIAFGVPSDEIDMEKVKKSAQMANLSDFVENEMPLQYETVVGERGIRLSGGQRQRIGIARALYRDPEILIFDEATSALDNITEKTVMEAIRNLGGLKTLIIIAHRLTTVMHADVIYFMEKGRMVASGKYEELIEENEKFAKMATVNDE